MIILRTIITLDALSCTRQVVYNNTDAISDLVNLTCYFWAWWCSSNAVFLHFGGARFASRPGQWLVWLTFLWCFSVPPGKCWDSTSIMPWLLPPICIAITHNNYTISHQHCHKLNHSEKRKTHCQAWCFLLSLILSHCIFLHIYLLFALMWNQRVNWNNRIILCMDKCDQNLWICQEVRRHRPHDITTDTIWKMHPQCEVSIL